MSRIMGKKYLVVLSAGEEEGDVADVMYLQLEDTNLLLDWLRLVLSVLQHGRIEGVIKVEIKIREGE